MRDFGGPLGARVMISARPGFPHEHLAPVAAPHPARSRSAVGLSRLLDVGAHPAGPRAGVACPVARRDADRVPGSAPRRVRVVQVRLEGAGSIPQSPVACGGTRAPDPRDSGVPERRRGWARVFWGTYTNRDVDPSAEARRGRRAWSARSCSTRRRGRVRLRAWTARSNLGWRGTDAGMISSGTAPGVGVSDLTGETSGTRVSRRAPRKTRRRRRMEAAAERGGRIAVARGAAAHHPSPAVRAFEDEGRTRPSEAE